MPLDAHVNPMSRPLNLIMCREPSLMKRDIGFEADMISCRRNSGRDKGQEKRARLQQQKGPKV